MTSPAGSTSITAYGYKERNGWKPRAPRSGGPHVHEIDAAYEAWDLLNAPADNAPIGWALDRDYGPSSAGFGGSVLVEFARRPITGG